MNLAAGVEDSQRQGWKRACFPRIDGFERIGQREALEAALR